MKRFYLQRKQDVSGVSGVGHIADGVQLSSGKVILEWVVGEHRSMEIWPCLDDCIAVHGHGTLTTVEWLDGEVSCSAPDFSGNRCRNCGQGNDFHKPERKD